MFNLLLFIGMSWNSSAVSLSENQIIDTIPQIYLGQINFDNDRYSVKPQAYLQLGIFAELLKNNPNINFHLIGFSTEGENSHAYSYRLSYKRAESVKNAMVINYGIDENQITIAFDEGGCSCVKVYIDRSPTGYIGKIDGVDLDKKTWLSSFQIEGFGKFSKNNPFISLHLKVSTKAGENEIYGTKETLLLHAEAIKDTIISKYAISESRITISYDIDSNDCSCVKVYIDTIPMTYIGQINFNYDRGILKEIYYQRLESISILLKNNPDFQLKIIGFSPYNPMISQRVSYVRAVAIRDFLIEKYEIKSERLVIEFYENEPDLCSCAKLYLVK